MSGVRIGQRTRPGLIDAVEKRRVLFGCGAIEQLTVQALDDLRRRNRRRGSGRPRAAIIKLRAQGSLDSGHEQGRRNSLPAHIAKHQSQAVAGKRLEIEVVPAHRARRLAHPVYSQAGDLRKQTREKRLLDFARDFELAFQARLLFRFAKKSLDRRRHAIKRLAERAQLVFGANVGAIRKIARSHAFCG